MGRKRLECFSIVFTYEKEPGLPQGGPGVRNRANNEWKVPGQSQGPSFAQKQGNW